MCVTRCGCVCVCGLCLAMFPGNTAANHLCLKVESPDTMPNVLLGTVLLQKQFYHTFQFRSLRMACSLAAPCRQSGLASRVVCLKAIFAVSCLELLGSTHTGLPRTASETAVHPVQCVVVVFLVLFSLCAPSTSQHSSHVLRTPHAAHLQHEGCGHKRPWQAEPPLHLQDRTGTAAKAS